MLAQYSRTIRDLKDMLARRPLSRPGVERPGPDVLRLRAVRNSEDIWTDKLRDAVSRLPIPFSTIANLESTRNFTDTLKRSVIAFFGGATLLVPMIIMSFRTSREACLITTSVSTIIFSLLLAVYTQATRDTLLAGTAAYTAVLVVFVGNALTALADH